MDVSVENSNLWLEVFNITFRGLASSAFMNQNFIKTKLNWQNRDSGRFHRHAEIHEPHETYLRSNSAR